MRCATPLHATFTVRDDGKKDIQFSNAHARAFKLGVSLPGDDYIQIPCGRCMPCRLEHSRARAIRCVHEAKMYDDNCFITLTYDECNLPKDGSLVRKDTQDFMKRLRQKFSDRQIKVFGCGEYGGQLLRPHYHLILFNCDFKDRYKWEKVNDYWYYRSPTLESLWKYGHSTTCDFSFEAAAYVARYCTKKINGSLAKDHYGDRLPEFPIYSTRSGGIGKTWFDKFAKSDLFPHDTVIARGAKCKPPRYYDTLRERVDPEGFAKAKEARRILGEENADDNSYRRLAVKLKCQEARMKMLIRKLER